MMPFGKTVRWSGLGFLLAVLAMVGLLGCHTPPPPRATAPRDSVKFRVGDAISVTLSDMVSGQQPVEFHDKVREDGTITLHMNQTFKAEGKTALELQKEIYDRYVPTYYKRMTVTVTSGDQFYTVMGYVRNPSQYRYVGPITVTQAIASSGDITQFGSRRHITLIRASGQQVDVNYNKALKDPTKNPQVFPGDTIRVEKRRPFGL